MKTRQSRSSGEQSKGNGNGLQDLFEMELKDIYWAEKALTKAIPKMINKATSQELVKALEDHLAVTERQVGRVEQVFEMMDIPPKAVKCEGISGIIKEGEEIMKEAEKGKPRDAGIIAAAQKVEHYEIASYGTLCSFAKTLGMDKEAELLSQTLSEEKEADSKLSEIAESFVNEEAMHENMTT